MNPLQKIEVHKNNYTNVEQLIYKRVKDDPASIIHLPIEDIATETQTSKAAIIRFCKKLGYSGFAEFKFELSRYIISGIYDDTEKESVDVIKSITSLYSGFIRQINEKLNAEDINKIANEIKTAHRVKIVGNNRTGLSAQQLRYRMSKIGYDAEAVVDMVLVSSIQDSLKKGDLVILFSVFAAGKTYNDFVKEVKDTGATIVLVTMTPNSTIEKSADYTFTLPCISRASTSSFLDDQALFFVFIEILLAYLAL